MGTEHEDDQDEDEEQESESGKGKEKSFTQAELNRISSKEKREGKRAGKRELLEGLGLESEDDLKALVQQALKGKKDDDDETEAAKTAAAEAQRKAKEQESTLETERLQLRKEKLLLRSGIDPNKVEKVAKMLDADSKSEDDDITDAIDDLKSEFPHLWESQEDNDSEDQDAKKGDDGKPVGTRPGSAPPPKDKKGTPETRAQQRLKERHGKTIARNTSSSQS